MKSIGQAFAFSAFCTVFVACASTQPATPGARPADMTVAGHEEAASAHEAVAQDHASDYDADATAVRERCRGRQPATADICWTSVTNPTAQHRKEAERHHQMAEDHRGASQALRDAESRACAGVPVSEQDTSPFAHKDDVAQVQRLPMAAGATTSPGAVITFKPIAGLTPQKLTAVVTCHLARNAAVGHQMPEMDYCPLVLSNVSATVGGSEGAVTVTVRSDDPKSAAEIIRRAEALSPAM